MNNSNKPKLSDIARQNNAAKVSKFASTMVPQPPVQREEPTQETDPSTSATNEPLQDDLPSQQPAAELTPVEQVLGNKPEKATTEEPTARSSRKRAAGLSMDDILTPKAPDEEGFAKMARISDKHHALLRKIAYEQRKPMNTIMYNLLEALDQAYQRDQPNSQNHA